MRAAQKQRINAGLLERCRILGNRVLQLCAVELLAFNQRYKARAGQRINLCRRVSIKQRPFVRLGADGKLRRDDADFFLLAGLQQQLLALRHADNRKFVRASQAVHAQHRQRVAGNNNLLHVLRRQPVDNLAHKAADFLLRARAVGRTRRVANVNKVLVRQQLMQTLQHG